MKFSRFVVIMITVLCVSCSSSLPCRIESYINNVESNCQNWNERDWNRAQDEYSQLIEEYERNYDSYSVDEKNRINKAIGRYNGILVKKRVEVAVDNIREFGQQLPSIIEGFVSAFDSVYVDMK